MEEIWKEYKTRRSCLKISNLGNVEGYFGNNTEIKIIDGRRCLSKRHGVYSFVWQAFNGPVPKGYCIHHINHNKLDDRLENLTLVPIGWHTTHHHLGTKQSEESIEKRRQKCTGKKRSDETKKKISDAAKERLKDKTKHPLYGKPRSEESKEKQRQKMKGRTPWNKGIKIKNK